MFWDGRQTGERLGCVGNGMGWEMFAWGKLGEEAGGVYWIEPDGMR